jgi:hypothetical protein
MDNQNISKALQPKEKYSEINVEKSTGMSKTLAAEYQASSEKKFVVLDTPIDIKVGSVSS